MKTIGLILALAAPACAATAPYDGLVISTGPGLGTATRNLSGYYNIAASSLTASTPTITLDGAKGAVNVSSVTALYGVVAATFTGSGAALTSLPAGQLTGAVPAAAVNLATVTTALAAKLDATTFGAYVSTANAALATKLSSGAVPAAFVDLSTVAAALPTFVNYSTWSVHNGTVSAALATKLSSGAIPSGFVDFSTITTALQSKLSSGAVPSGFVDFSTIATALNSKLSSGAIPSGFVDFSTITTAINSLDVAGGIVTASSLTVTGSAGFQAVTLSSLTITGAGIYTSSSPTTIGFLVRNGTNAATAMSVMVGTDALVGSGLGGIANQFLIGGASIKRSEIMAWGDGATANAAGRVFVRMSGLALPAEGAVNLGNNAMGFFVTSGTSVNNLAGFGTNTSNLSAGAFQWIGTDNGSSFRTFASITGILENGQATGSIPGRIAFGTARPGATSSTTDLTLDSTGTATFVGAVVVGGSVTIQGGAIGGSGLTVTSTFTVGAFSSTGTFTASSNVVVTDTFQSGNGGVVISSVGIVRLAFQPHVTVTQSAVSTYNIPPSSETYVFWNSQRDTQNASYLFNITVDSSAITAVRAGHYCFNFGIQFNAFTATNKYVVLQQNGSVGGDIEPYVRAIGSVNDKQWVNGMRCINLVVGDTVRLRVYQDSGSVQTIGDGNGANYMMVTVD